MRALVVSNMLPTPAAPGRGVFVRDQVAALRAAGADVTLEEFAPGDYLAAARRLRRRHRGGEFDVVHAHFGLTAFTSLAIPAAVRVLTVHGTDVRHARSGRLTRLVARRMDLVAAVSAQLGAELAGTVAGPQADEDTVLPAIGRRGLPIAVLPCGVAMDRFVPIARDQARRRLGLPADQPCLLFPADPARAGKRHDLALAAADGATLHTFQNVASADVPLWINAANAIVLPTEAEGFGLAVLEALACDVPVITTPVGIHPRALADVPGSLCAPFDLTRWRAAAAAALAHDDPRVPGRACAERWSSARMADRVAVTWERLLAGTGSAHRGSGPRL